MSYDARIWTDGSQDRAGYGGAAAIVVARSGKRMVVTSGHLAPTTNQRMELMAAIVALNRLWWRADSFDAARARSRKRVVIYSDSAYLVNCFNERWIDLWRKRNWVNSQGKQVANREFWETLENLVVQYREVRFIHIRGHQGDEMNELADSYAVKTRIAMSIRGARLGGPGADAYERERALERGTTKAWQRRTSRATRKAKGKRAKV